MFCFALTWFRLVTPLDRVVYDVFNELLPLPVSEDIVIVAMDETSLREIGRWPWPRETHVELLRRLRQAGVKAVAIDILFAEPYAGYPQVDTMLAQAVADLGVVVLPVFVGKATEGGELWEILPIAPLRDSAAALGHVHIDVATDGVAREVFLQEGLGLPRWPHFALALARLLGVAPDEIPGVSAPASEQVERPGVILRSHANLIRFMGPAETVPRVSFVDVMKGRVGEQVLRDKIVFVGATAAGHADNITTSLGQIPGVEVNANIFQALRSGQFAQSVDVRADAVIAALLVAFAIALFLRLPPRPLLAVLGLSVLIVPLLSLLLFQYFGLWVSPVPVVLTFLLSYPLWSWLRLAAAVDFIRDQLAQLEFENQRLSYIHPDQPAIGRGADPVQDALRQLDRAHSEARYNHELVRQTLEEMSSGVILAEMSGRVLMENHEAMGLLGSGGAAASGRDVTGLLEALDPQGGASLQEALQDLRRVGDRFSFECAMDSGQRHVLLQGGVIGLDRLLMVFVLTDITELKESEKKRAEALNFLSHDLRAPLTSVLALLESARENATAAVEPQLLAQVESYVRTNLSYAEDFIHLARMDHGAASNFDLCDSAALVDNAVAQVFHTAAQRGIDIRIEYSDSSEWVYCERHHIERALINLIDNAIKHSPDGSEVRVAIDITQDSAIFTVSDQGDGIDAADATRLFAAFEQGRNATRGVGLGLRFVSVVAANHGGSLSAENREVGGSSFRLRVLLNPLETSKP